MMNSNDGIFAIRESLESQMKRFQQLRETDEARCKKMFTLGEMLLECASRGQFGKFQRLALTADKDDILIFFVVRMIEAALCGGHLLLAGFMIDNGYPLNKNLGAIPNCLHVALKNTNDTLARDIVEFLVSKRVDVNAQEQQTWDTALHIAIRRNLFSTCEALMEAGADVNAVAKNDIMPLNLAEASLCEDLEGRAALIRLLEDRGARRTWRRQHSSAPAAPSPWGQRYQTTSIRSNAARALEPACVPSSATTMPGINVKISGDQTKYSGHLVDHTAGNHSAIVDSLGSGGVPDENGWVFRTVPTPVPVSDSQSVSSAEPVKKVSFRGQVGSNSVQESVNLTLGGGQMFSTGAHGGASLISEPAPVLTERTVDKTLPQTTTVVNRRAMGSTSVSSFIHSAQNAAPDLESMDIPGVADGKGSLYQGVPPEVDIDLPMPQCLVRNSTLAASSNDEVDGK